MLELGPAERGDHREIGEYAAASGVDVLIAVGPRSSEMPAAFGGETHARPTRRGGRRRRPRGSAGDVVLVKASRGIGLETVAEALAATPARG